MRCTHGIQYELKCPQCVAAALADNKEKPRPPESTSSKVEREAFWSTAYRQTITKNEY